MKCPRRQVRRKLTYSTNWKKKLFCTLCKCIFLPLRSFHFHVHCSSSPIECVHTTSRRSCWVNKETAAILEEWNILLRINSIFLQIPLFVSLCKHGFWLHERTHCINEKWTVLLLCGQSQHSMKNFEFVSFLSTNRPHQVCSGIVSSYFAYQMTWKNREIITEVTFIRWLSPKVKL